MNQPGMLHQIKQCPCHFMVSDPAARRVKLACSKFNAAAEHLTNRTTHLCEYFVQGFQHELDKTSLCVGVGRFFAEAASGRKKTLVC